MKIIWELYGNYVGIMWELYEIICKLYENCMKII